MAIHAEASEIIAAAPERVSELYLDYAHWPQLFPETIRSVLLVREDDATRVVEVEHATAGTVLNVMTVVSPFEVRLQEFKPRYDATFTNRFEEHPRGTRYTVIADVQLKGVLRLLSAIAPPIVRRRVTRFVLRPMKARAEAIPWTT